MGIENDAAGAMAKSNRSGSMGYLQGAFLNTLINGPDDKQGRRRSTSGGGSGSGGAMTAEQFEAKRQDDDNVTKNLLKIRKQEAKVAADAAAAKHIRHQEREASRTGHVNEIVETAAKSGSPAEINVDKKAGQYNFKFHPGYGSGGQGGSQQQNGVKPAGNTKTAEDRAPAVHTLFDAEKNHGGYMVEGERTSWPTSGAAPTAPAAPKKPRASRAPKSV